MKLLTDEVERALRQACRRGHAEIIEFTVAPRGLSLDRRPGHEWLIEFAEPPRAPGTFVRALDETLQQLNADYRTEREAGMAAPWVIELPAGTFYRWMRIPGNQGAVSRVTHDRAIADAILTTVTARGREPLIAVGA